MDLDLCAWDYEDSGLLHFHMQFDITYKRVCHNIITDGHTNWLPSCPADSTNHVQLVGRASLGLVGLFT